MSQDLVYREALGGVLLEHAGDEVLGRLTQPGHEVTRVEVERLGADASLALVTIFIVEG